MRWTGTGGKAEQTTPGGGLGPLALVADVDLDGEPNVVAGNTAYNADGSLLWQNASLPDGSNAIGNFDSDPFPEVVLVAQGNVWLLEHTGTVKWGPMTIPGGPTVFGLPLGGPPTVADMDVDGVPEIGIAGAANYSVLSATGALKWSVSIKDQSSGMTGSSVFDFDGDGSAEVVYRDEAKLRVYRGSDGVVFFETDMSSCTWNEYPLIADVDADGNAEIVIGANNVCFGQQNGIYVIGDRNDTWVPTRQIWNQHSYHISNINDDGTIPRFEANSWQTHNTYRLNLQPEAGGGPHAAPDLIACYLRVATAGQTTTLTARIGNGGEILVGPGINVGFYNGDPRTGGTFLGTVQTTTHIVPGAFEDVSLVLMNATIGDVWVVADDGSGPPSMRAGGYEFSTVDVPGSANTAVYGVNSLGQVVGEAIIGGIGHAFLRNQGVFSTFAVPAAVHTEADGINDRGQIVGTVNQGAHGFLTTVDTFGTMTPINVPGAAATVPSGINEAGEIVGYYTFDSPSEGTARHGFLRSVSGTYTTIDYPDASSTWALGNNDSGQIVGKWGMGNTQLGSWVRDAAGQFTSIAVPLATATATTAQDVNDAGQIVGLFNDASTHTHGFLWDAAGKITVLDVPGSVSTQIRSISDAGQIAGVWQDSAGLVHGFVGTPVGTVHECDEANNFYHVPSGPIGSAEIHGTVFNDLNGDGQWQQGDFIYWSTSQQVNRSTIRRARLDGSCIETIAIQPNRNARFGGIAFDVANGHLYASYGVGLFRANFDGSGRINLFAGFAADVELDLVHRKVYWCPGIGEIKRADLDGNNIETVATPGGLLEGIAVDPHGGKVYFGEESLSHIGSINLNGSGRTIFKSLASGAQPFDVEIDPGSKQLYWVEHASGILANQRFQRANLDGTGGIELVYKPPSGSNNGFALDPLAQKIYYSGAGGTH